MDLDETTMASVLHYLGCDASRNFPRYQRYHTTPLPASMDNKALTPVLKAVMDTDYWTRRYECEKPDNLP